MPRATAMQVGFNAGEWRATLDGRIDLERYGAACKQLRNYIPLVEGPAERRAGTRFVEYPPTLTYRTTLIPFEFNTEQAYALALGEYTMRFFTLSGLLVDAFDVPIELATPWSAAQARRIQYRQSADVMFLFHPEVPSQKLERTSASSFTLSAYAPDWAPFRVENAVEADTIVASAKTGAITLTAAGGLTFTDADIGRLVRLRELVESEQPEWQPSADIHNVDTGTGSAVGDRCHWAGNVYELDNKNGKTTSGTRPPIHTNTNGVTELDGRWSWKYIHSGAGYARITDRVSSTVVNATVIHQLPDSCVTAATFRWAWGAWDDVSGYPRSCEFYEERLWVAGTDGDPDTIWATRPGGSFDDFRPDQTAEGGLQFRMLSGKPNPIQTLVGTKTLNIATSGGLFPASGSDPTLAVSIENPLARQRQVNYGALAGAQGLAIDNVALFIQRSGRSIREVLFDFDQDSFASPDLSKLASHLLASGVVGMAYAQEPYRLLLVWMEDGTLAAALYDRPQEALGWFKIELGGTNVVVESVAVIPHPDGDRDQIWLAVARTFGSTTERTIEFIERGFDETTALADAFFVDAGVSYSGAPVSSVTGLAHLEGQTVEVLADGARQADRVVSGGAVSLDGPASKVSVGLGYRSRVVPMRFEAGSDDGTAQGKTKRISHAVVRVFRTAEGLHFGATDTNAELDEAVLRDAFDLMSTAVPVVDGDSRILEWPDGYDQGGLLAIEHRGPTPSTIVSIMPKIVTSPR